MLFLRQSTASQEILLGPFVDSTDGNTQETALSIANTDIKLWKEGGTTEASKNSGGATHIASGRYYAVLDATDTDTVGKLEVNVHVTGALAVRREFMVLEEAVYDALFAASAAGYQVPIWASASSTVNLSATTIKTATDVETDTADIQTRIPAALVSGRIDASVGAMAAGVLTATAIAADAITDAKVAADVTIASVTGSVGSVTGNVGGNVVGSVASVTGNVSGSVVGAIGSLGATAKADVNAEVLDVLTVDTFTEASTVPAATSTLKDKINWLFALARNKVTQTATTQLVRNDADSATIGTSTVSDDGTTFTRGEYS